MADPAERLLTDLPIWVDCPYHVPRKKLEVRRGKFDPDEPEMIVIWCPSAQKHIDLDASAVSAESFKRARDFLLRFC